jgi:hypothetical protein
MSTLIVVLASHSLKHWTTVQYTSFLMVVSGEKDILANLPEWTVCTLIVGSYIFLNLVPDSLPLTLKNELQVGGQ